MKPARRRILPAYLVWAALAGSASGAAPVIYSPSSGLANTTADQQIQLFVSGTDLVAAENINIEINDGTFGPIFKSVDIITASIFASSNNGQNGAGIATSSFAGRLITLTASTVDPATVLDNGLLVTLTINTSGQTSNSFQINVLGTHNGSTNFLIPTLPVGVIVPTFPNNTFAIGGNAWKFNGGGTWNSTANWDSGIPGVAGDWANFLGAVTAGTGAATVTLDGNRTVGKLYFSNSSASYTVAQGVSGTLQMDNSGAAATITSNSGIHAITAPISFVHSMDVIVGGGSKLTLAGPLSGAGLDLDVSGTGTLVLSGANNYAATNILGGAVLQMGAGAAAGTLGLGAVADGGALVINRSDTLTFGNTISGPGAVVVAGSGTVTLTGSNSYTGTTTLLAGALNVTLTNCLANSTLVYNQPGGELLVNVGTMNLAGLTGNKRLAIGATTVYIGGTNLSSSFDGGFAGSGAVHKVGSGLLQVFAPSSNDFTGSFILDSGTLALTNGLALGAPNGSLVFNGGKVLIGTPALAFNTAQSVVFNADMAITRLSGGTVDSFSGDWIGTNRVTTLSLPTGESLLFNGTTGQFTAYSGRVSLDGSSGGIRVGGLIGTTPVDITMSEVTLDLGAASLASGSGGTQTIGALNGTSNAGLLTGLVGTAVASTNTPITTYVVGGLNTNSTFMGNMSNGAEAGALTALRKVGLGSLTIAGSSKTYIGGTVINGGTIVASSSLLTSVALLGTGPVTMGSTGARLQFSGSFGAGNTTQSVGNITAAGGTASNATVGVVVVDSTVNLTSGAVRAGSLTINGGHTLASNSAFSKVTSLSIGHTGSGTSAIYSGIMQLNNNRLIMQTFDSTNKDAMILSLNEAIFSGRGTAGTWTGTKGITSSAVAANTAHLTVGVYDNAALRDLVNSSASRSSWAGGIANVDGLSLLVTPALKGDANLDGMIDIADMVVIANNWNKSGIVGGISTIDMAHGDINVDGVVDIGDMVVVANNWNQTSSFNLAAAIIADDGGGAITVPAGVPEPASLGVFLLAGVGMLRRRRRKSLRRSVMTHHLN